MLSSMRAYSKPASTVANLEARSLQLPVVMVHAHALLLPPLSAVSSSKQAHATQKTQQPAVNPDNAIDSVLSKFHKKTQGAALTDKHVPGSQRSSSPAKQEHSAAKKSSSKDTRVRSKGSQAGKAASKATGQASGAARQTAGEKRPSSVQASRATPSKSSRSIPQQGHVAAQALPEDDLEDLTSQELDRLFDEVYAEVSQTLRSQKPDLSEEDATSSILEPSKAQGNGSTGSTSIFKGFGAPPKDQQASAAASQPKSNRSQIAAAAAPSRPTRSSFSLTGKVPPLRIFLYAADAKQTIEAIQAAGWESQVVISEDLQSAHAVVAAKQGRTGKHHKLQQGERTARNSKVPFVCVGRRMSKDNLVLALAPVLQSHQAQHGVLDPDALNAAIKAAGVSPQRLTQPPAVKVKDLPADWRQRRIAELGLYNIPSLAVKDVASQPSEPVQSAGRELAIV